MRVLVTGSAGYIGSVLVPALQRAGHEVLGYDLGWFGPDTKSKWWVRGDIRDPLVHPKWPEVIVHMAGLSNDPMGELSPALTHTINHWGTVDMMTHHYGVRHVVISSCAVYGQATDLCDEGSPVNPQTTYARAKAQTDEWLRERGYDNIVLRLGTVYGPSPNHRLDLVVNKMVHDAIVNRRVIANGNAARPLTHIEDVASAIVWAVENEAQGIHNVVGENTRMLTLARDVADLASCPVVSIDGGPDTRDYMASGSKLLAAGWSPTRTVAGSLPALFDFTTDPAFAGGVRIQQLRALIDGGTLDKHLRFAA